MLCSEILLDSKNVFISIRKTILALAKIGSCKFGWRQRAVSEQLEFKILFIKITKMVHDTITTSCEQMSLKSC